MIWSIDMDDFRGSCMGLPFPLINSAKEELKGYKVANLETSNSNILGAIGNKIGTAHICKRGEGETAILFLSVFKLKRERERETIIHPLAHFLLTLFSLFPRQTKMNWFVKKKMVSFHITRTRKTAQCIICARASVNITCPVL